MLELVLVSVGAVLIAYGAFVTINLNGLRSTDLSDADFIRQHNPIHLVRPEWVAGQGPDMTLNWISAEIKARFAVIFAFWLCLASIMVCGNVRKSTGQ